MINIDLGFKYRNYFKDIEVNRTQAIILYTKYIENLGKFLIISASEWQFLSGKDFLNCTEIKEENDNKFLSDGIINLGKNILEYGSYWPLFYTINNEGIRVFEGSHRVNALQSIGSEKQILSIRHMNITNPMREFNLCFICPPEMVFELKQDKFITNVQYLEGDLYSIQVKDTNTAHIILVLYSMFLSEIIFNIKPQINGALCINDKYYFIQWYYNQIKKYI